MAYINLTNACVTFAIYNCKTRSVRHKLFSAIGGSVNSIDNNTYIKAVDNISCIIKDGDRVGLIGHNGAGKSTFLKLISGVYAPTSGEVSTDGYISSLTDITMGMDPELSGYDNIIMRCIFMGMTFKRAKELAESIIDFSELHEYINLPLRTYSTGMYLRLAFSTATSIAPNILIMDEMIGAGDSSFLNKARERILALIEKTKIMVLSSHDMQIMKNVCNRGIWMEKGKIRMDGEIHTVIEAYNNRDE